MKLGDAEHPDRPLPPETAGLTGQVLGHRTALQSINSEDAITWSAFGALLDAPPVTRAALINWLCERLGVPWTNNTTAAVDLWRRIPHPDKPRAAGGPELDAVLVGDRCVIFVEAKWGSKEGVGQGAAKNKTQVQLRREFLAKYGARLWGDVGLLVLGVVRAGGLVADSKSGEVPAVRSITWEALAGWPEHPQADEFRRYVAWKTELSQSG